MFSQRCQSVGQVKLSSDASAWSLPAVTRMNAKGTRKTIPARAKATASTHHLLTNVISRALCD